MPFLPTSWPPPSQAPGPNLPLGSRVEAGKPRDGASLRRPADRAVLWGPRAARDLAVEAHVAGEKPPFRTKCCSKSEK